MGQLFIVQAGTGPVDLSPFLPLRFCLLQEAACLCPVPPDWAWAQPNFGRTNVAHGKRAVSWVLGSPVVPWAPKAILGWVRGLQHSPCPKPTWSSDTKHTAFLKQFPCMSAWTHCLDVPRADSGL